MDLKKYELKAIREQVNKAIAETNTEKKISISLCSIAMMMYNDRALYDDDILDY